MNPRFVISWTGERLDLPARGVLSRVMGNTSRRRTGFSLAEVSLEREAALPVSSQSAPPSTRALFVTCLGEQFLSLRLMFSCVTWVFTLVLMGPEFALDKSRADDEVVSWREQRFHAYEMFSRTERNSDARGHLSVPVENSLHHTAGEPD